MSENYPFRLYGEGLTYGARIDYRVHFADGVPMDAAVAALASMQPFADLPPPHDLFVSREGQFASFGFNDMPDESHDFEPEFLAYLRDVHEEFPILEVLAMSPGVEWHSGDWERWSVEQQEWPDEGPTFGVYRPWWLEMQR